MSEDTEPEVCEACGGRLTEFERTRGLLRHEGCLDAVVVFEGSVDREIVNSPGAYDYIRRQAWNPRYLAYCRGEHPGLGPDAALEADQGRWIGGCMTGFILWIGERWREWLKANPDAIPRFLTDKNHKDFTQWLDETYR